VANCGNQKNARNQASPFTLAAAQWIMLFGGANFFPLIPLALRCDTSTQFPGRLFFSTIYVLIDS